MDPLTTPTITEDVKGATVVVSFNGLASFGHPGFLEPCEIVGPFHSYIGPVPAHATTQYALESSELAALLTALGSEWRPQHLSAPAPQLSTPAEYDAAVQCLAAHPELPEGWYAFAQRARRHRDWLVGRVEHLKEDWQRPSDELYLEAVTTRKLCDEINKVFASWRLLSEAVAAWEKDHAESYLTQVWNWATGSTKAKAQPAPPASRATVVQTRTDTVVVPTTAAAPSAAAPRAAAPTRTPAPSTPSRAVAATTSSPSPSGSHSAPPSPASSTSSRSTGSSSLAAHHQLPFLAWTTATPSLAQLSIFNATPVPFKPAHN
ncbi:hypothetical protein RQP46_006355 [Phenoliferia psychrophenolica]